MLHRSAKFIVCCLLFAAPISVWAGRRARVQQSAQAPGQASAPEAASSGIQFTYGGNVAQAPAQIAASLVLVPVRVNGSQPSWFLLDTMRPSSAIDDVRAVAVGLYAPTEGAKLPKSFSAVTLEFPGLKISLPSLALDSFGDLSARIGHAVQGVLGADVLSRLIIKIDYDGQHVQFYDPKTFQYSGNGLKFPMQIVGGVPAIDGKMAVHHRGTFRGTLAIATAQTEPLEFSARFAAAHEFDDLPERMLPFSSPDAASDTDFLDRLGRVHALQISKIVFADPVAVFPVKSGHRAGGVARQFVAAIGGEILSRFTVVLDYPAQLLILEPNKHVDEIFAADMSGLEIVAIPPAFSTFVVARVTDKSPASATGVAVGDMIEKVDGNPASDYTLDNLQALLRQETTTHRLTFRRNGKSFTVTMTLKPLI